MARRKMLREIVKLIRRRLLAQQTVVGAVLWCGKKVVAMWQLPHFTLWFTQYDLNAYNTLM